MADVGVREKDAVERTAGLGPAPKGRAGDEIDLPRQIGRRVDQVEPLGAGFHESERRDVPVEAPGGFTPFGIAADLWQSAVLHGSQHEREHLLLGDEGPAGGGEHGTEEFSARG